MPGLSGISLRERIRTRLKTALGQRQLLSRRIDLRIGDFDAFPGNQHIEICLSHPQNQILFGLVILRTRLINPRP